MIVLVGSGVEVIFTVVFQQMVVSMGVWFFRFVKNITYLEMPRP